LRSTGYLIVPNPQLLPLDSGFFLPVLLEGNREYFEGYSPASVFPIVCGLSVHKRGRIFRLLHHTKPNCQRLACHGPGAAALFGSSVGARSLRDYAIAIFLDDRHGRFRAASTW